MPSHTHANVTLNSTTVAHDHDPGFLTSICCDGPGFPAHNHLQFNDPANTHSHSTTVSFGAADLGSPNWWEHRHPIILVSMVSAGGSHRHAYTNPSEASFCSRCGAARRHEHTNTDKFSGYGGAVHTHTLPSAYTGYADPSGTPENHVHPFNINFNFADDHSHAAVGWSDNNPCGLGYIHAHNQPSLPTAYHNHSLTGDSGSGGEAPPSIAKTPIMDGFVYVE